MATVNVTLDQGDVSIVEWVAECDGCTETRLTGDAIKVVVLDLRNNGESVVIGRYCPSCAEETAARLRASLPSPVADQE